MVAPGNKVISAHSAGSAFSNQHYDQVVDSSSPDDRKMIKMSGSSMATPLVSGAVALLLDSNPNLTPNMVKMILEYTAQPLAGFNHLEQGAGQLNIDGAVRLARVIKRDVPNRGQLNQWMLTSSSVPSHYSTIIITDLMVRRRNA